MLDEINRVMKEYENADKIIHDMLANKKEYDADEYNKCSKIMHDFPLDMAAALINDLPYVNSIAELICVMEGYDKESWQ